VSPPAAPAPPRPLRDRPPRERRRNTWLALECILIFFIGPALFTRFAPLGWLFPALWACAAVCFVILIFDRDFRTSDLLNPRGVLAPAVWKPVLLRFAILAPLITLAFALVDRFYYTDEHALFALPRRAPGFWAIIMVAYPVFSVYPQELIWRSFFYRRYDDLFAPDITNGGGGGDSGARRGERRLLIASSLAFAWAHLMFPSPWVAMSMTFVGGLLFAGTYQKSRSLLAAALEHALYGCLIFTIGMGRFFYSGGGG
jgi:membrane protease YdiL (CAAX protease family)